MITITKQKPGKKRGTGRFLKFDSPAKLVGITDAVQWLIKQKASGAFRVKEGKTIAHVYLEKGAPVTHI